MNFAAALFFSICVEVTRLRISLRRRVIIVLVYQVK